MQPHSPVPLNSKHQVPDLVPTAHIGILGAGAIGQLIYHQLQQCIHQPNDSAAASSSKWRLSFISKTAQAYTQNLEFSAQTSPLTPVTSTHAKFIGNKDAKALQGLDLLIVCVKSYQVETALSQLLPQLSSQCHILLLHNGMGPHLAIATQLTGQQGLSLGTTSQGALRLTDDHVQHTGRGLTQIGHYCGSVISLHLKTALLNAIPGSRWCEPILPALWQKLAINACINPLTAIYRCKNGALAEKKYLPVMQAVIDEIVLIAAADEVILKPDVLLDKVLQVIKLTAENYSSMYQDIHHQRPSEINMINGYILKRAAFHHLSASTNQSLLEQVTALQPQS